MPKLYYSPTSCAAASFIAAYIAGVAIETELVNVSTHTTASGVDFYTINPKGNVPTIVLDSGVVLSEGAATLQWIADQNPNTVAPAAGTDARYEVIGALNYIASEVHSNFGPLFNPANSDEVKAVAKTNLGKKFSYLSDHVIGKQGKYLTSDQLTIADIYLYIVLSWHPYVGVDISSYPIIANFYETVKALPEVVAAHERIGTSPATAV